MIIGFLGSKGVYKFFRWNLFFKRVCSIISPKMRFPRNQTGVHGGHNCTNNPKQQNPLI